MSYPNEVLNNDGTIDMGELKDEVQTLIELDSILIKVDDCGVLPKRIENAIYKEYQKQLDLVRSIVNNKEFLGHGESWKR